MIYLAEFLLEWKILQKISLGKIKAQFYVQHIFQKYFLLKGNVEKYGGDKEAKDENICRLKDRSFITDK